MKKVVQDLIGLDGSIYGKDVVLRPFNKEDITERYVAWLNDPEVVRYSNQRFHLHSIDSCRDYYAGFAETSNLFLKIVRRIDGVMVGTMTAYLSAEHRTADMGIMVGDRSSWGMGIGQDAWDSLLKALFAQGRLRKITGGTMRCNQAMVRIMERSGMTLECVRPQQELLDGKPQDLVFYGTFSAL